MILLVNLLKQKLAFLQSKPVLDPEYDLIFDEQLGRNEYPAEKMALVQASKKPSLMAQHMSRELYERLKHIKTKSAGWTIARSINTGVMNPSSQVGCHAGDLESYLVFSEFFNKVIESYHSGYKADGSMKHVTDMDVNKITTNLEEDTRKKIVSTRIRVARNLAFFPLNAGGTKESRLAIADLMEQVCAQFQGDLKGKFYRHTNMSNQERQSLIDDHFLFRGGDKMQAASGYHQHWPYGRGIFVSNDKKFLLWINEGDHIRIISMEQGGDVKSVFDRLSRGVLAVEVNLKKITGRDQIFMEHPHYGQITACPSNLGTGMRGSVHILLPKLINAWGQERLNEIAREHNCQVRGSMGEHTKVIDRIDISNWRRLGYSEHALVQDMINTANYFSKMEDEQQ